MRINVKYLALFLGGGCLAGGLSPASAADWKTAASVTPSLVYTDNVCLSSDGEQGELIGLVTPAGSISANGNRANLNVSAALEINTLTDGRLEDLGCGSRGFGDRNQFSPRLNGTADAILVDQWLYVDASANVYQSEVTPFINGGGDSLDRTGNTNTVTNYSVSPYIVRRFKDLAIFNLKYTWDEQVSSVDVVGDSVDQRAEASIKSVAGTSRWSWGLQGSYSDVDYSDTTGRDSVTSNELSSARFNTGYNLNRSWQVNAHYGQEWNDFVSSQDEIDGDFWDVGLRWTPNSRTTVSIGTGERFFGTTPRFAISYRHKRSELSVRYRETLTYDRSIRAEQGAIPNVDSGLSTLSNSPILDEKFTLAYSFQGKLTRISISGFQSNQTRQDDELDTSFRGASISSTHNLSRQTLATASLRWSEQDPKRSGVGLFDSSETWRAAVGLQHQLSKSLSLGLNYEFTERSADGDFANRGFNEYTENRVALSLTINL